MLKRLSKWLGSLQVVSSHMGKLEKPATLAAGRGELKAAAVTPPVPQPREPAAVPVQGEASDPRTTAAISSDVSWDQKVATPQPFADVAAREREAALAEAKTAARLDVPKVAKEGSDAAALVPHGLVETAAGDAVGCAFQPTDPARENPRAEVAEQQGDQQRGSGREQHPPLNQPDAAVLVLHRVAEEEDVSAAEYRHRRLGVVLVPFLDRAVLRAACARCA